jgi:hypothetical protein
VLKLWSGWPTGGDAGQYLAGGGGAQYLVGGGGGGHVGGCPAARNPPHNIMGVGPV